MPVKSTKLLSSSPYAAADFGNQLIDDFGTIPVPTDAEMQAARVTIAAHAVDADEARELLAMLGLGEGA